MKLGMLLFNSEFLKASVFYSTSSKNFLTWFSNCFCLFFCPSSSYSTLSLLSSSNLILSPGFFFLVVYLSKVADFGGSTLFLPGETKTSLLTVGVLGKSGSSSDKSSSTICDFELYNTTDFLLLLLSFIYLT